MLEGREWDQLSSWPECPWLDLPQLVFCPHGEEDAAGDPVLLTNKECQGRESSFASELGRRLLLQKETVGVFSHFLESMTSVDHTFSIVSIFLL